jgi:dolichol kinase
MVTTAKSCRRLPGTCRRLHTGHGDFPLKGRGTDRELASGVFEILGEITGAFVVLMSVGAVLAIAAELRRTGTEPELTRKLAHVGTALAVLPMPTLVQSAWTIPLLAVIAGSGVWTLRRTGNLGFLDDVKRSHASEYWYVAALAVLQVASRADRLLFAAPVLVLGLSDAAAALVGKRFGRRRYTVFGVTRSLEGSLACALSAFALVEGALFVFTGELDPARGALVAVAVATAEGASPGGVDNFSVPISALLALWLTRGPWMPTVRQALLLIGPIVLSGLVHQLVRRRDLLRGLARSLDDLFFGGRLMFGRNKTLRGFVVMPAACAALFGLERVALSSAPLPAWAGAIAGLAYVLAELPNSYFKRRLGVQAGAPSTPLFFVADHLDSALGCAIAFLLLLQPWAVVLTGLLLGPLLHVAVNRLSWAFKLRSAPW